MRSRLGAGRLNRMGQILPRQGNIQNPGAAYESGQGALAQNRSQLWAAFGVDGAEV
ncbi:hypothetical protein [Nodosilinea nodulosa]|uniref:hypothetical protein n=1 Tax=Nodosilinea nodulosa TaxID=416001 RepID=UPI00031F76CB|nr:hypothetical protein [Nodosilinea nodulosa]